MTAATASAPSAPHRAHYNLTFWVLAIGAIAYALLQSLVVPALPDIQKELHTSETSVSWVLTAYLLSASVGTPIIGRLGDMYGKERVLLIVLVMLAVGTLMSAVATSMPLLLAGRVVQGAGGGIFPLAFGIIRDEFPRERVAGGIGLMSSLLGIGGGAGVVLAGPIVQNLSYHWLFYIPLLFIVVAAIATHFFVPESPVKTPGRVNWLAAGLMSLGLVAVLVAVSQTIDWGWISAKTLGLIAFGSLVLVAWIVVEVRSETPLVDMKMMRIKGVWTTNAVAFLLGVGMYSSFILIPQFVQEPTSTGYGFGASVVASGLFLLPSTVAMVVVGQFAGRIEKRVGSKPPLIFGAAFSVASFLMLTFARSEKWEIYVAALLLGIGIGLAFAAMANLIVSNVRQDQTGVATGMNTVMRTLGGALGGQIAATFLANDLVNDMPTNHAYGLAFGMCTIALMIGLAVCFLIPKRAAVGEVDPARPPIEDDDAVRVAA
jgi:EmrB/QacA subfamily drug resistance transporter